MKKLVCLMLVALICTAASAASMSYQPVSGGNILWDGAKWTILPNLTAGVKITADVDLASTMAVTITASKGSAAVGTFNALVNSVPNAGTLRDGTFNNVWISKVSGGVTMGTPVVAGNAIYTFNISSAGLVSGDVITLGTFVGGGAPWGGSNMTLKLNAADTQMGGLAVTVVPEPMTMALLGLGGLFIRRRK